MLRWRGRPAAVRNSPRDETFSHARKSAQSPEVRAAALSIGDDSKEVADSKRLELVSNSLCKDGIAANDLAGVIGPRFSPNVTHPLGEQTRFVTDFRSVQTPLQA